LNLRILPDSTGSLDRARLVSWFAARIDVDLIET